jgi:hypothetical protein
MTPARLKRLAPGIVCLMVTLVLPVTGPTGQTRSNSSQQLRQAETAANQIVQQFHKDLDFKEAFARNFVAEPRLVQRVLAFDPEDKWGQFDLPTRKRFYVAMMTFVHLWLEYMLIQKQQDAPPEIDRDKAAHLFSASGPKTMADLNQAISDFEQLSTVYRKHFPSGIFESAQYHTSIAESIKSAKTNHHNVPRVEKGNAKFGIPETVPVYIVRPEEFDYYFIRENGAMKLFYVDILPNFKLF